MKEEYWVFGGALLFQLGILLYRYYQKRLYRKAGEEIADSNYDRYLELRDETFALKPKDLGIVRLPDDDETAFALMIELHTGTALQALVAFINGTVWVFNSLDTRKSISNDSDAEDLHLAAIDVIVAAQYHFARMRRRDADTLLPGHIKFHILTNLDIYSAGDTIKAMLDESSQWAEIVSKAFNVVDEFNNAAESEPIKRVVYPKTIIKRRKPANF